jgi:hypothetical protein
MIGQLKLTVHIQFFYTKWHIQSSKQGFHLCTVPTEVNAIARKIDGSSKLLPPGA